MGLLVLRRLRVALAATALVALATSASAQLLGGALWFERQVGAGVTWKYYHFDNLFNAKQSVSYIEIDLNNPNVGLKIPYRNSFVGPSPGVDHPSFPRARTSVLANSVAGAKAAINGTYFNTASYDSANPTVPWGGGTTYLKSAGTIVHTFDGTSVNHFRQGILFNGRNDVTIMRKSGAWSNRAPSWQNMMISGPVLISGGVLESYDPTNTHATARHPRSAVGKNNSSNKLIFLTVDGRTAESAGMSCSELALVMQALGCNNATNLDGGGSTTLWAAGEPVANGIVNYPSDNGAYDHAGERGAANALVVTSTAPAPKAWDGRLNAHSYGALTRSGETLTVTANYTNLGTQSWTASTVKVVPSRALGRSSSFVPPGQENSFFTMTPATVATGQTATFTINLVAPAVASNTLFEENFALSHATLGYFGPADSALKVRTTVRPPITGAPPMLIVQGTPDGPNNQWYTETGSTGWANSQISFTAEGVANVQYQRYCPAASTGRFADFKPIFDVPGVYKVEAAFPYSSNNITSVQYVVNHLNGANTVSLNQNNSALANTWQNLGQFSFGTGAAANLGVHSVRVTNGTTTGNRFYSGALRFDYVGPLPPALTSVSLSDLDQANAPLSQFTNSATVAADYAAPAGTTADAIELSESAAFTTFTATALPGPVTFTFGDDSDGPKTLYARLRNASGVSPVRSASIVLDSVAPMSSALAPAVQVGGQISGAWSASDPGGSGVRETRLQVRHESGSWQNAGSVTGGAFATTPAAGSGAYYFQTVAFDNAGNAGEAPLDDSDPGQSSTLYNAAPNAAFTRVIEAGSNVSALFPMKNGGIHVVVTFAEVTAPGTLTVSRQENNAGPAGLNPQRLIGQRWSLTPGAGLAFTEASVSFVYEDFLLNGIPETALTAAYKANGPVYTQMSCETDAGANACTVNGVTSFSDWYIGLPTSAAAGSDWTLY